MVSYPRAVDPVGTLILCLVRRFPAPEAVGEAELFSEPGVGKVEGLERGAVAGGVVDAAEAAFGLVEVVAAIHGAGGGEVLPCFGSVGLPGKEEEGAGGEQG